MNTFSLEHIPEDMTATVESGMTLAALQSELARHGQWLPIDPPHAESLTIGQLLDANLSGPRRFGYGTIRDYVIGMKVVLADGTVVSSGGKVVKNVAGYDLMKLFIGAQSTLGSIKETTFKLRPLPEKEQFVQAGRNTLQAADKLIENVLQSEFTPVILDLHNLNADNSFTVVLGFAGTGEEVDWQLERAAELGCTEASSLGHEKKFWSDNSPAQRISVLPSKMLDALCELKTPFVARAGNGVIYHRGPATPRKDELPLELMRRVKDAYDPKHLLPDLKL